MVYLAEKESLKKEKVVSGFVGYIKQFASLDLNNLKPDMDITATSTAYFFKSGHLNHRKNNILRNYINRDVIAGRNPGIMNVEEIATIWHFPNEEMVKAPLVQKTAGRKAEAPMSLPKIEEMAEEKMAEPLFLEEKEETEEEKRTEIEAEEEFGDAEKKGAPPGNLPVE